MDTDLHNLLRERVALGVDLLDRVRPDWRSKIDISHLSLSDSCRCVLGQIGAGTNAYIGMLSALGMGGDDPILYGFDFCPVDEDPAWLSSRFAADDEGEDNVTAEGFGILDELWIEAIREDGDPDPDAALEDYQMRMYEHAQDHAEPPAGWEP